MAGPPPLVIGVDAAKKTGVAVINNLDGTVATLAMDGDDQGRMLTLLRNVPGAVLVVEKHGAGNTMPNWAAAESLVQRRMRWQVAAEIVGVKHVEVVNSVWQNKMLRSVTAADARAEAKTRTGKKRKVPKKGFVFKARAEVFCRRTWGTVVSLATDERVETYTLTEDERDALCIARWYSLHGWLL